MIAMKKVRNARVLRPVARLMAGVCLFLWGVPPAHAFRRPQHPKGWKTQTPDPELRARISGRERRQREATAEADSRPLTAGELSLRGRGALRNPYFGGVLPWQRSFRDVNCATGNLFKSFTDIQVRPARGAGLAWQRTYSSNDGRVGPFGVGWTHAYDIRMEESADVEADSSFTDSDPDKANKATRTDFFGGKHRYHRDADGLYSPPPYLYDELSSNYLSQLVNGPPSATDDLEKGMEGGLKHFTRIGRERVCDWLQDRHGNQTTLTYGQTVTLADGTQKGLLTRVTDPSGRYLDISWTNLNTTASPAWRITQVQGPYDPTTGTPVYVVSYEYGADFNLWKVHQDPGAAPHLNRVTTFTYTSFTNGTSTESGLLASISDPLGHTVSYSYGMPAGDYTGTVWITGITEPSSGGTINWSITPQVTSGQTWPYSSLIQDSTGAYSLSVHSDPQLRYAFSQLPSGPYLYVTTYSQYDNSNNVVSVSQQSNIYGPSDYYRNAPDIITNYTYGPHGNVLTQQNYVDTQATTTTYYDASKYFQKASVTDPNGHVTRFDYFDDQDPSPGNRGEVKWVQDARYGTTGAQFTYTYNQYGQKASETNLNGVLTQCTYGDTWGNLTQTVQDPGAGHLNRTTTMSYDVAGRVTQSTDPKSQSSSFTYNAVGQPLQATLPAETVSYGYGGNGRTESVTDGRGTTTMAYEAGNDRVSSVTDPVTGAVAYTYGLLGERRTMSLPGGGTWTYDYNYQYWGTTSGPGMIETLPKDDPNSLAPMLTSVTDQDGRKAYYYSDLFGRLHEVRNNISYDGGGSITQYQQCQYFYDSTGGDGHGWTAEVKNAWNYKDSLGTWQSSRLVQNDYTYDPAGQRLTNQITSSDGTSRTEQYGYDELNRLTSVNYGDGETQGYTFDPMGNRLTKTDSVTGNESYTYNNANMLLTRNGASYTNDSNGNSLTGGGRTNTWDGENRLTQCAYNGTTSSFTNGADGLRHRSVAGANTTDYVLDGDNAVRTLLNGAVDKTWLHGARGPEYERTGSGTPLWYLYDGLGSVLGTVDGSGNIINTRKYDVYGAVRASTGGSGTKHKFVGALGHPSEDETGLVYMRARYFDPVIGRFASEDPDVVGKNWFTYCDNAPTNRVDASGKASDQVSGVLIGIIIGWLSLLPGGIGKAFATYLLKMGKQKLCEYLEKKADELIGESIEDSELGKELMADGAEVGDDTMFGAMIQGEGGRLITGAARKLAVAEGLLMFKAFLENDISF